MAYFKGNNGKTYTQNKNGSITVTRPDGSSSTYNKGDKGYNYAMGDVRSQGGQSYLSGAKTYGTSTSTSGGGTVPPVPRSSSATSVYKPYNNSSNSYRSGYRTSVGPSTPATVRHENNGNFFSTYGMTGNKELNKNVANKSLNESSEMLSPSGIGRIKQNTSYELDDSPVYEGGSLKKYMVDKNNNLKIMYKDGTSKFIAPEQEGYAQARLSAEQDGVSLNDLTPGIKRSYSNEWYLPEDDTVYNGLKSMQNVFNEYSPGNPRPVPKIDRNTNPIDLARSMANNIVQAEYERNFNSLWDDSATDIAKRNAIDRAERDKAAVNAKYDDWLKQEYIQNQLANRSLGEDLATQGINGGATETALMDLELSKQNNMNRYNLGRQNDLMTIDSNTSDILAQYDIQAAEKRAEAERLAWEMSERKRSEANAMQMDIMRMALGQMNADREFAYNQDNNLYNRNWERSLADRDYEMDMDKWNVEKNYLSQRYPLELENMRMDNARSQLALNKAQARNVGGGRSTRTARGYSGSGRSSGTGGGGVSIVNPVSTVQNANSGVSVLRNLPLPNIFIPPGATDDDIRRQAEYYARYGTTPAY